MYNLYPFIITNYEDTSILQNSFTTIILKDRELIKFLNWIDINEVYEVSNEEIESLLGKKHEEILDFMINNKIIHECIKPKLAFKDIIVISNDKLFLDNMQYISQGIESKLKSIFFDKNLDNIEIKKDNLYLVFLNPFNITLYTNISDILHNKNVIYRIAFYYNNYIFVSNYHKKEWVNPCPICFYHNVESSLKAKYNSMGTTSFQSILDIIYKRHPDFNVENKFTNYSIKGLVNLLLDQIDIKNNAVINNVYSIDFINNIVSVDEATTALDQKSIHQFKSMINNIKKDKIILLISHNNFFDDITDEEILLD